MVEKREYFSITHLFYAVFLIFLLFHGTVFWLWLALPLSIYFIDVLIRSLLKTRKVKMLAIEALSDGVTKIRFAKPKHFLPVILFIYALPIWHHINGILLR